MYRVGEFNIDMANSGLHQQLLFKTNMNLNYTIIEKIYTE